MAAQRLHLHGSCSCGRFRHVVDLPSEHAGRAELRYDNSSASRQHSASPLILWLRVPLPWYASATFAQFPDETHSSIQRTFISPFTPTTSNKFCGYCGTQLSSWSERTRDDAQHICLPVGSLLEEDQALLSDLGFFGNSSDEEASVAVPAQRAAKAEPQARGAPWFEEIVRDTGFGRFRQQRGRHSDDGIEVEWEVTEWIEGEDDDNNNIATSSKRKIGDLEIEETGKRLP